MKRNLACGLKRRKSGLETHAFSIHRIRGENMEQITERYYLGSNKNTYILYEKKMSSTGKETYKNIGYFSSLDALYNALIEKEIKEDLTILSNMQKIQDMIKELREFTVKHVG